MNTINNVEIIDPIIEWKEVSERTQKALQYLEKATTTLKGEENKFRIEFPWKEWSWDLYTKLDKSRGLEIDKTLDNLKEGLTKEIENLNEGFQFITWESNDPRNELINNIPDIAFESKNMA